MKITWNINSESVLNCLKEAGDTFYQLIEDLGLELSKEKLDYFEEVWNDSLAFNHIKYKEIDEIRGTLAHSGFFDNVIESEDDKISFDGCIIVLNDEHILDGNHRLNTISRLNDKYSKNFKIPTLFIYKDI